MRPQELAHGRLLFVEKWNGLFHCVLYFKDGVGYNIEKLDGEGSRLLYRVLELYRTRGDFFLELLGQHIRLSLIAVVCAGCIGLLLGIFISEHRRVAPGVIGVINVFYTIPSISLLGILLPFTGIGDKTALIALTIYALMPMVRNTYAGITSIDPAMIEAGRGMGCTNAQMIWKIKLPLALPVILTGLRSMVVMVVAMTGIASFIGAGGLGVAVFRGITINNIAMTVAGSILIALFALVCDFALGRVEHYYKKKRKML